MGQECECKLRLGGRTFTGRAQLETDYLLFRGGERLKVPLKDLTNVTVNDGVLTLQFPGGPATLELGAQAEKWARKILHPPTLLEKLGVKPGLVIALEGEFDQDFQTQIGRPAKVKADLLFYAAAKTSDLCAYPAPEIQVEAPAAPYGSSIPKASPTIRETEVIAAGRAAGLKDTKVVRFSDTHTALRFSFSQPG